MGEYSYVSVNFEHNEVTAKIMEDQEGPKWAEYYLDPPDPLNNLEAQISWYVEEARYGFENDDQVVGLVERLMASGVAFTANDGGGYDWPETDYAWEPGMDKIAQRYCVAGGDAALTSYQHRRLIEHIRTEDYTSWPGAYLAAVDGHFSDDPRLWLEA